MEGYMALESHLASSTCLADFRVRGLFGRANRNCILYGI